MSSSSLYASQGGGGESHRFGSAHSSDDLNGHKATNRSGPADEVTAPGDFAKSSSTLRPKEKRTLWIGDLDRAEGTVDDNYVVTHMFFEFAAYIMNVRICRDRVSRLPSFGFVEFVSQNEAQYVLEHMNGRFVPGRMHKYRLNWANFNLTDTPEPRTTFSRPAQLHRNKYEEAVESSQQDLGRRPGSGNRGGPCPPGSTSIWVGSLDPSTCREEVEELFEQHYSSICMVRLITDPNTGICKGFGFVHFRDPEEAERALEEMNGAVCRGRRIRCNKSNNTRANNGGTYGNVEPSLHNAMSKLYSATASQAQKMANEYCGGFVPTKRTRGVLTGGETAKLVVRGLDPNCSEEELRRHFGHFGEVIMAKVAAGGKAHVTFAEPTAAANAVHCMDGATIGTVQVTLELSSGRLGESTVEARDQSTTWQAYYEANATEAEWKGEGYGQANVVREQQALRATQAAQYAQYYQMQITASSSAQGANNARAKSQAPATEESLNGGMFGDTDPCLVPAELLPAAMFSMHATAANGAQERHTFSTGSPCHARLEKDDLEKFEMEQVEDEQSTCIRAIDGALRKRLKTRVVQGLPLEPEDHVYLYSTALDGSVACY